MKLIVNGEALDVAAETLSELLVLMEYEGDWLATAVNGELVHSEDRFDRSLNDNDRIEILSPMQGG
ncbi:MULTISPECIES: sulfur carrier protein ThiS [Rhizobium]|uniref:sulfur carrier protein ThiS n=1 Tax=Rhizobium TaxID=379 RepID=UPI001C900111|nr:MULTISPECIES: sulfur carrier protein ThiS [Rhizobium]MBY3271341.1 sulfur carrier protein ThiS [Rhizobium laguerreae]MBY3475222.1 sulfur carrier protein ThiS [Rhizobium laguerreae]MBY3522760.1 sulfur carrier protein ThiS [Rhizobium laguerreae]MBY3537401.1 sulfur carrier protein ThiS [Rhizobium laguerreae]MBY3551044.1 sulfur carrier protein ThiS [Rhizobium laguerreae]